jgi:hypothetical protein
MARIRLVDGELVVMLEGLARVAAVRGELRVPLAHVIDAHPAPERTRGWLDQIRQMPNSGTHIPGVIKAGTFITVDGPVFYAVHDLSRAVAVELEDERFRRLVIEPPTDESPEACAERIRHAAARVRCRPPVV